MASYFTMEVGTGQGKDKDKDNEDNVGLLGELARLIEHQSVAATQLGALSRTERELFRVRAKRIDLLLAVLCECETANSRTPCS